MNDDDNSPRKMQSAKLILMGSASSGKTSMIRQFVFHEFRNEYAPTKHKCVYHSTVSINDEHIFDLRIVDVPPIAEYPTSNEEEWNFGLSAFGLRTADVYLLVFDVTSSESLKFATRLREQILSDRPDALILVAGNKHDLMVEKQKLKLTKSGGGSVYQRKRQEHSQQMKFSEQQMKFSEQNVVSVVHRKLTRKFECKPWLNTFVECSAKYNWRVTAVFRESVKLIEQHIQQMATPTNKFEAILNKRKVSLGPATSTNVRASGSDSIRSEPTRTTRSSCAVQ